MTSRTFPTLDVLRAAAVLAVLALGGCGGSDFKGDVRVPDGYAISRSPPGRPTPSATRSTSAP